MRARWVAAKLQATPEQQLAMAKALCFMEGGREWPPDRRSTEAYYMDMALQVWAVAEDNASPQPDRDRDQDRS